MTNLNEYVQGLLNEAEEEKKLKELEKKVDKAQEDADEAKKKAKEADDKAKEADKAAESIKDEKTFRDYAENKFKEVFGDKLDTKKMNDTINGLLKDNKDAVDKGDWGTIVGMLNKSFGA